MPSELLKEQVTKGSKVISLTANENNHAFLNACGTNRICPAGKSDKSANSTCKGAVLFDGHEDEEMHISQVPELLPESPPSFGDAKDMGGNITESGSRESVSFNLYPMKFYIVHRKVFLIIVFVAYSFDIVLCHFSISSCVIVSNEIDAVSWKIFG